MANQLKRRARYLGAAVLVAVLGGTFARPAAAADEAFTMARVRSANPLLATLIRVGVERSSTLRRLIQTIDATDGLVYVEDGKCGHGVRACLVTTMRLAGPHRLLFVLVDARGSERDLIASLGHELRHAVEVLSIPGMKSYSDMYYFYTRHESNGNGSFETQAAIDAGNAVRAEIAR
jgi:hypothetical protein